MWQVERCTLVSRSGVLTDLEPSPDGAAAVVPTFTPAQFERAMNTRAAASSMERRQRTMTVRTTSPSHAFLCMTHFNSVDAARLCQRNAGRREITRNGVRKRGP